MVEFALILPLLMLLTFGVIEFAVLFNANSSVAHAGRAGGRTAGISSVDTQLQYNTAQAAASALDLSPGTVEGNPVVCVGKYNPSVGPCGEFSMSFNLVHNGDPGAPTWEVDGAAVDDVWAVEDRQFGCDGDGFDRVVVRVSVQHELVVPALFGPFFGSDNAPGLKASSVFQLEPVPASSCPATP
jgi:hypothetical protein